MNKICKQYISEVKTLFPIMGKSERKYIEKLKTNVDNYCEEVNITTKEELYKNYGLPNDVVNDYYFSVDTDYVIKKIRFSKYIKVLIVVLIVVVVTFASGYCVFQYQNHQMSLREEAVIVDETIEEIS